MRWTIRVLTVALALLIGASVSTPMALAAGGCDECYDVGCNGCGDPCSSGCGAIVADIELTFLRYFQEGGVADLMGEPAEFDYEFAPRFVLGYKGANGLGIRTRYWELDASDTSVIGTPVGVNAYTIDWELFQEYCLGCDTTLELSFGLRYSELWLDSALVIDEQAEVLGLTNFSGFGGTMAAQVNRSLFRGNVYARARVSLLMGDAGGRLIDVTTGEVVERSYADDCTAVQTELGLGYEICRSTRFGLITLRTGVEWQNWANMAITGPFVPGFDTVEDAGFAGFVVGLGLER